MCLCSCVNNKNDSFVCNVDCVLQSVGMDAGTIDVPVTMCVYEIRINTKIFREKWSLSAVVSVCVRVCVWLNWNTVNMFESPFVFKVINFKILTFLTGHFFRFPCQLNMM